MDIGREGQRRFLLRLGGFVLTTAPRDRVVEEAQASTSLSRSVYSASASMASLAWSWSSASLARQKVDSWRTALTRRPPTTKAEDLSTGPGAGILDEEPVAWLPEPEPNLI